MTPDTDPLAATPAPRETEPPGPDAAAQQERMKWRANERADRALDALLALRIAVQRAAHFSFLDTARADTHVQILRSDWEDIGRILDRALQAGDPE